MATPPTSAPTPSKARIKPHAGAPPRDCFATTGPNTNIGAKIRMLTMENSTTITHSHVRDQNSCQPARNWRAKESEPLSGSHATLMRESDRTLSRYVTPSITTAQPGLATAIITPARGGPMMPPTELESPFKALACCSFVAEMTWGTMPVMAGLKKACPAPTNAANNINPHSGGAWVNIHQPRAISARARRLSEPNMSTRRLIRSANTPPANNKSTTGTKPAAAT